MGVGRYFAHLQVRKGTDIPPEFDLTKGMRTKSYRTYGYETTFLLAVVPNAAGTSRRSAWQGGDGWPVLFGSFTPKNT